MLQNEFLLSLLLYTSDEDWVVVEVGIEDERTKIYRGIYRKTGDFVLVSIYIGH